MPVSEKRLEANRRNAQKSTGPKTESGKATSSRNATRHGLFASDIVINSPHLTESEEDYHRLYESLVEELHPQGALQEHCVRKIANCLWRSRRALAAETAELVVNLSFVNDDIERTTQFRGHFDSDSSDDGEEELTEEELEAKEHTLAVSRRVMPNEFNARRILWYEMRLDVQIARAYELLKSLQRPRRPAASPEPDDPPKSSITNPGSDSPTTT
jgi:hypothetical protein